MDAIAAAGMEAIAIPHNSNGSNGQMFKLETFDGKPLDGGYAETRMRNEPIVEVTQVKGTSEVHPLLSPNDEWADFEIFPLQDRLHRVRASRSGSYVREAYLNGLVMEEEGGFNPYRFGLIGSTDTHNCRRHPGGVQLPQQGRRPRRHARAAGIGAAADPAEPMAAVYAELYVSICGARRASPVCGRRRTPGSRSSTPCAARRPLPPRGRGSGSGSSAASTSTTACSRIPR